jgi:hypothetical protein
VIAFCPTTSRTVVGGPISLHDTVRRRPRISRRYDPAASGAFTVDNFPVFDYMRPNVLVAADLNHGFKMILVEREIGSEA